MTPFRRWLIPPVLAVLLGAGLLLSTSAATAASPSTASATHVLRIAFWHHAVRVTVPRTWHVSNTAPTASCGCNSDYQPVCIVAHGDYDQNPYRCELIVGGGAHSQQFDIPLPDWRLPRCGNWNTSYEAGGRLGALPAQYRIFADRCAHRKAEQWVSESVPSIGLWHPLSWGRDDAAAAKAAASVRVSGTVTTKRIWDLGRVRDVQVSDGHAYVTLDRVVPSLDGRLIDRNHKTYRYRLYTPSSGTRWAECLRDWSQCSATQLRRQFAKGTHPADGTRALAGRLVLAAQIDPGRYPQLLRPAANAPFTSIGDPGHCGC